MATKLTRFSPEVQARAVRMVLEHRSDHASQWAAITSIATKIGCKAETLRLWVRQAIVLGDNVERVVYQHAADRRKARQPVFLRFWRSTAVLAGFGLVPFGLIMLYGPPLFAFVFGAAWETAGRYARWIALASFAFLLGFPARQSTALFGLQKAFAETESCRALASAAAVVVVAHAGGDALVAVTVGALAQAIISLAFVAIVGVRLYDSIATLADPFNQHPEQSPRLTAVKRVAPRRSHEQWPPSWSSRVRPSFTAAEPAAALRRYHAGRWSAAAVRWGYAAARSLDIRWVRC